MMKVIKMLEEMVEIARTAGVEAEKFEIHGNMSAGARVRKAMQELKKKAQEVRLAVNEIKKAKKEG